MNIYAYYFFIETIFYLLYNYYLVKEDKNRKEANI